MLYTFKYLSPKWAEKPHIPFHNALRVRHRCVTCAVISACSLFLHHLQYAHIRGKKRSIIKSLVTGLIIIVCQAPSWPSAYRTWIIRQPGAMDAAATTWTWILLLLKHYASPKRIHRYTIKKNKQKKPHTASTSLCSPSFWTWCQMMTHYIFMCKQTTVLHCHHQP